MQVRDDRAWAEQLAELEADEMSKKFKVFLLYWAQELQSLVENQYSLTPEDPKLQLGAALSKALEVAEQTMGYLSIEWIGQMLLVITQHWVHGEQLTSQLSHIERRVLEQATALKLAELQASARVEPSE